ncbi:MULTISPECIES: hypothetical protein [unclassified Anabaena]|uniref:hypothetical protein n=1 Tax=unclassified Anabaena TaxID=2619674 RepID=UPI00082D8998|nr:MULTISPECIES: hypothetical protein [unclassified Anabaena]
MSKIPTVYQGIIETDDDTVIELDSPQWLKWLENNKSFRYEPKSELTGFTARVEKSGYWYAYRRIKGKLHKRYIGKPDELTVERLEEIAALIEKPPELREVTYKPSATETIKYATTKDVTNLWQALRELRQEVAKLAGSPTTVEEEQEEQPTDSDNEVADSEIVTQLQNQVTELQNEVKSLETKLNYARKQKKELEDELASVEKQNSDLKDGTSLKRVTDKLRQQETENQKLKQELQRITQLGDEVNAERNELAHENWLLKSTVKNKDKEIEQLKSQVTDASVPDYEAIRDRILSKLRVGRQSAGGKAIDTFIRELKQTR